MTEGRWRRARPTVDPPLYELFHENSKSSPFDRALTNDAVVARMAEMWDSLPYEGRPRIDLPVSELPRDVSVAEALGGRRSARSLIPSVLDLAQLSALLGSSYGVTALNEGTDLPRPFRAAPSAGALYPLELYFHTFAVEGLDGGLYHYNPAEASLRHLRSDDVSDAIAGALVQAELAYDASLVVFITAAFERSTFKYGERGYRFALLEAGHVAQNLNLAAYSLGYASINLGGFFDRAVDALLGLDGVAQSTLYLVAIGEDGTTFGEGDSVV